MVSVRDYPNKTMPVYYDEFDIPDHDCIFQNIASVLPALIIVLGESGHCGGRVNSARFPRRSATLMLNAGTMTH